MLKYVFDACFNISEKYASIQEWQPRSECVRQYMHLEFNKAPECAKPQIRQIGNGRPATPQCSGIKIMTYLILQGVNDMGGKKYYL